MARTSLASRGCRKSVLGISLDFESALISSGADSVRCERDLRVLPLHSVAFPPPVRDDADDHGLEVYLLDMDERGEGVFRSLEVVKSLDLSD